MVRQAALLMATMVVVATGSGTVGAPQRGQLSSGPGQAEKVVLVELFTSQG